MNEMWTKDTASRQQPELEQKLRDMAQQENAKAVRNAEGFGHQTQGGMLGGRALMEPGRPSLRETVASQLHRANTEKARAERLAELEYLLEKNPDVARILDLVQDVQR